jgi:hypothetical protein
MLAFDNRASSSEYVDEVVGKCDFVRTHHAMHTMETEFGTKWALPQGAGHLRT